MADEKGKSGGGGNNAIIVALLATGAIWFARPAPLETERPAPIDKHIEARFDDQDVEARLWQDPLEAIAKQVEKADAGPQKECAGQKSDVEPGRGPHCRSPMFDVSGQRVKGSENALVLAAVVPGAPYFEDSETRRRLRYAVLSGLMSEYFVPNDEQHIGYFRPLDYAVKSLPAAIPYESFKSESDGRSILLLWVDEDIFKGAGTQSGGATKRLLALRETLCPEVKCGGALAPKFGVLGPYSSDAWRNFNFRRGDGDIGQLSFCAEGAPTANGAPQAPKTAEINFYSPSVTGESQANPDTPVCDEKKHLKEISINFVSAIAGDKAVAETMVKELERRGVRLRHEPADRRLPHVALVTDFDTRYGRAIVEDFDHALSLSANEKECGTGWPRLHTLRYLRGLDGMVPAKDEKKREDKDQKGASDVSAVSLENAFGPAQFDYLRRLAAGLKLQDDELRRDCDARIEAIGVLGNDVFDKLLALRALRPLFPEAIFFTTDFDQALANANDLEWSRNLLVASAYGPTLSYYWQGHIPPFRSVYQTSAFVAARLAADEFNSGGSFKRKLVEEATRQPRLFEIDRRGEFLSLPTEKIVVSQSRPRTVQPRQEPIFPQLAPRARVGLYLMLIGAGACLVFLVKRRLLWPYLKTTWLGLAVTFFLAAGVAWFWPELGQWATDGGLGEPIAIARGVSVWPTIALRAIGAILALCLTVDASFCLRRNFENDVEIGALFLSGTSGGDADPSAPSDSVPVGPEFEAYRRRSSLWPTACRVMLCSAGLSALFVFLCDVFGWPSIPWRGAFDDLDPALATVMVGLMAILTFLVADATVLCLKFVVFLRDNRTRWMTTTRGEYIRRLGLDDEPLLDDWIDLRFMAARTKCIGNLIYMPFAISALLMISRSALFVNFAPSAPLLIIHVVAIVVLFACAMMLCFNAERAREIAKKRIADRIQVVKADHSPDPQKIGRLEDLLKHVEELHEGAFVPLSEQPPIRALLLPLGGLGWTALLDYRLLPGL
jgi:hypothetical protein